MSCLNYFAKRFVTLLLAAFAPLAALHAQSNYATPYSFATLAGTPASVGSLDGIGAASLFNSPNDVAVDGQGTVYVADSGNHTIRKITVNGVVTVLAGKGGSFGSIDGTGSEARFKSPSGVTVDGAGNIYVADLGNNTIRKITAAGMVTTLAGSAGNSGSNDGTGSGARFDAPWHIAVDGSSNVYVTDWQNATIRRITAGGVVTTLASGTGPSSWVTRTNSTALFSCRGGVATDGLGNVYVSDTGTYAIYKIIPSGEIARVAPVEGSARPLSNPVGLAADNIGNLYTADYGNNTIWKISSVGAITALAGNIYGNAGSTDGLGSTAQFNRPNGVAVDGSGNVYVADTSNNTIRKITPVGDVTTMAGSATSSGSTDGPGNIARFADPAKLAFDSAGVLYCTDGNGVRTITPDGTIATIASPMGYRVAFDTQGNFYSLTDGTIRKLTPGGVVSTIAGLSANWGTVDGTGSAAQFNLQGGVAMGKGGILYVADTYSQTIRKVTVAGVVTTLAGMGYSSGSADGTGSLARFSNPDDVAVDGADNVYVADTFNSTIRKITPAGVVTTLAGSAVSVGSIDGIGSAARFNRPQGVAVDAAGNVYVADTGNNSIRKITPSGEVTTLAGMVGANGSNDGIGSDVRFDHPLGLIVDESGNIYVADTGNNTIRKGMLAVIAAPSSAIITITVE